MQVINLLAIPNQSLSINLDQVLFDLTFKQTSTCMSVTVFANSLEILSNSRLVASYPIIPYRYLESGNFIFLTANDDLPDYTQFGLTQTLVYASAAELGALREN